MEIPSRRHYGNYPQIEDGVGMIRSFLNRFEKVLNRRRDAETQRKDGAAIARKYFADVRTHPAAAVPQNVLVSAQPAKSGKSLHGTILTGEMFAPMLSEMIEQYNAVAGTRLSVLGVPNTYFGGDVSVAGLLSGQDYLNVQDQIKSQFVIIPKHTIKSDEPILLDGMAFDELKAKFPVPIYEMDLEDLMEFLA